MNGAAKTIHNVCIPARAVLLLWHAICCRGHALAAATLSPSPWCLVLSHFWITDCAKLPEILLVFGESFAASRHSLEGLIVVKCAAKRELMIAPATCAISD